MNTLKHLHLVIIIPSILVGMIGTFPIARRVGYKHGYQVGSRARMKSMATEASMFVGSGHARITAPSGHARVIDSASPKAMGSVSPKVSDFTQLRVMDSVQL